MNVQKIENRRDSNMKQQKTILASGCILAAGIMWGTMGLWVRRFAAEALNPVQFLALRIVVTVVLVLAFLVFYDRKLLRIRLKDLWCFLGTGIFSIVSC